MTDEHALLAAICAHPYEDTPRLAFADWLDEQGGKANTDRAAFIRLQIELAGIMPTHDTPATKKLRKRAKALEKKFEKRLAAPLIGKGGPLFGGFGFTEIDRGFVYCAEGAATDWVANGNAVFRLAPVTKAVVRDLTRPTMEQIAGCAWATRPDTFEMRGTDPYARRMAGDPPRFDSFARGRFPNLKSLLFRDGELTAAGAGRVAAADPMPNLETLHFEGVPFSAPKVTGLFGKSAFSRVKELYFSACFEEAEGIKALAKCKALARVENLTLLSGPMNDAVLEALSRAAFWPTLRRLEVYMGEVSAAGTRKLAERPGGLTELRLDACGLDAEAVRVLTAGDGLRGVRSLNLDMNTMLGDGGAEALARCPHLAGLMHLYLEACNIGAAGAKALAESKILAGLERITLTGNSGQHAAWKQLTARFGKRMFS